MSITKRDDIPKLLVKDKEIVFIVNILSHKWSLFIILSLAEPMRFNQLRRHLEVSHSVLSKELKYLEALCIVNRRIIAETNPPSVEYSLTDYGVRLLQICREMKTFGGELEEIVIKNNGMEFP